MKVVEIQDRFGIEQLKVTERPRPSARPGQVLLRMRGVSLNYRDLLMIRGRYNAKQPLPLIPGSDGVGEVVEVGEGVDRVIVGDRVAPIFSQDWISGEPTWDKIRSTLGGPLGGTWCEYMAVGGEGVVPVPEYLTDDEAATLSCAGVTAWNALAGLQPGSSVLIQGTGGVSIFALQFAKLFGARAIVTSSSDEKLERARALGAWETINYRSNPDWGREARRMSGGGGVDVVVEVGGADTLSQAISAVRPGGQISMIGTLSGGSAELSFVPILMRQIRVQGILVGHRESFEAMNRAMAAHQMRPAVNRVFPVDEVHSALKHMSGGQHFGKLCLRIA